jgi:hypothetical protein
MARWPGDQEARRPMYTKAKAENNQLFSFPPSGTTQGELRGAEIICQNIMNQIKRF